MSKYFEVNVKVTARVLVRVDDDEGQEEAMQYASDEYTSIGGDVETSIRKEISEEDSESGRHHYDLTLMGQ